MRMRYSDMVRSFRFDPPFGSHALSSYGTRPDRQVPKNFSVPQKSGAADQYGATIMLRTDRGLQASHVHNRRPELRSITWKCPLTNSTPHMSQRSSASARRGGSERRRAGNDHGDEMG